MKRKVYIALMLAFAAIAAAQDSGWDKKYCTGGALNGRWWMAGLSQDLKLGLVMGITDGTLKDTGKDGYYTPGGMAHSERTAWLDIFFDDPLNRSISIRNGLVVINLQRQGKDVSGFILLLRKEAK